MSLRGEFACRFGTDVTQLTVWARWSAGIAAGGGLGWAGGCCVRGRRRTIAIVAEWWSIEVLHGEVSAFRWQEQHDSALIEAALTKRGPRRDVACGQVGRGVRGALRHRRPVGSVPRPARRARGAGCRPGSRQRPDHLRRSRRRGRYQGAAQAEARAGLGCRFAARARGRAVSGSGDCLRTGRPADDGRGVTAAAGYVPSRAWPR